MLLVASYSLYVAAVKHTLYSKDVYCRLYYVKRKNRQIALYTAYAIRGMYVSHDSVIKYAYDEIYGCSNLRHNTRYSVYFNTCTLFNLPFQVLNDNLYRSNCEVLSGGHSHNRNWRKIFHEYHNYRKMINFYASYGFYSAEECQTQGVNIVSISRKNRKIVLYATYLYKGIYIVVKGEIKYVYDHLRTIYDNRGCHSARRSIQKMTCEYQWVPYKVLNKNTYRYDCDRLNGNPPINDVLKAVYYVYFSA